MNSLEIRLVEGYAQSVLDAIAAVNAECGGDFNESFVANQLSMRRNVLCCLAYVGEELAGYKVGYEDRPYYFESWLGAVAPAHRRRGVARELMAAQHQWCQGRGYRIVTTLTEGSNRAMLIANLQAGFDVCGTFLDRGKVLKAVLQKRLE